MARTAVNKTDSPENLPGILIANATGTPFLSPWEAVTGGANNGVTFSWSKQDLILLGNSTNGASKTFTLITPEPDGYDDYGASVSDPTVIVPDAGGSSGVSIRAFRATSLFRDTAANNVVSIDSNATGGYILIIKSAS
jgi:hypothetical protein